MNCYNSNQIWIFCQDCSGGERQRIFWRHHYIGAQGIVFVVDVSDEERMPEAGKVCIERMMCIFIFYYKVLVGVGYCLSLFQKLPYLCT